MDRGNCLKELLFYGTIANPSKIYEIVLLVETVFVPFYVAVLLPCMQNPCCWKLAYVRCFMPEKSIP